MTQPNPEGSGGEGSTGSWFKLAESPKPLVDPVRQFALEMACKMNETPQTTVKRADAYATFLNGGSR